MREKYVNANVLSERKFESETEYITPYHWKVLKMVMFGYFFYSGGIDTMIFSLCLPMIMKDFMIGTTTIGLITSLTLCGQSVGGLLIGVISDLVGRKKSLIIALCSYYLSTILCSLASSWWVFAIFRAFMGFGALGAQAPISSLLAEIWPAKYRAISAGCVMTAWGLGMCTGALLVKFIAPYWGWRGCFLLIAILGLLVSPITLLNMKETSRFEQVVQERKKQKRNVKVDIAEVFCIPRWRKNIIIGMIPVFCQLSVLWTFLTFGPNYIMTEVDYSISKEASWFFIINVIGIIGFLVFGYLSEFIGRKLSFGLGALISVLSLPLAMLWGATNIVLFNVLSSILLFGLYGTYTVIMTYLPELFPTRMRSTGVAVSNQTARIFSMTIPYVVSILATRIGIALAVSLTSMVWIFIFITVIFGPETRGKVLEQITGTKT